MDGEANECGLFVGFVSEPHQASEDPPGKTKKSIGFSSQPPTFNVAGQPFSVSNVDVGPGTTIGVGVDSDDCEVLTVNGRLLELEANADKPRFNALVGVIATSSLREEVLANMGQLPFKFQGLQPPPGWLVEPNRPRADSFEKGPPSEAHLLHFFPFLGTFDDAIRNTEGLVAARPFRSHGRYEVTLLAKPPSSLICVGLSCGDFRLGYHVGWDRRCIGVHSDNGGLYREAGQSRATIIDPSLVQEGSTIGISLSDGVVTYSLNHDKHVVAQDWSYPSYPTITVSGSLIIVVNFGESPFVYSDDSTSGVLLFNGVRATMTNKNLGRFGLLPGDVIETRDLSFRGVFVGELRGYLFVRTIGFEGAFPFAETEPGGFRRVARVVFRTTPSPSLVIAGRKTEVVDLSTGAPDRIYATRNGISLLLGRSTKGKWVMRPIVDLFNNAGCFCMKERPVDVLEVAALGPVARADGVRYLDVVEDVGGSMVLVLGRAGEKLMAWNNVGIVEVQPKSNVLFRFFGFYFKQFCVADSGSNSLFLMVNCGMQRGGSLFLPNYQGTHGAVLAQHSTTQKSYGAEGFSRLPPAVELLLRTLNESFVLRFPETIGPPVRAEPADRSFIIDIPECQHVPPKMPLVTAVKARKAAFRPT
jgi:hypothetical protein